MICSELSIDFSVVPVCGNSCPAEEEDVQAMPSGPLFLDVITLELLIASFIHIV